MADRHLNAGNLMKKYALNVSRGYTTYLGWSKVAFCLAAVYGSAPSAMRAQAPADLTTPKIATNLEAKDVETKVSLLQQELYAAEQEITLLSLARYEDHLSVRRVLLPNEKELVPGYIFSPKPLDKARKYPGLILVHGGFHGRLDWRFFDLIDYAVAKGYVVMFPEYRSSAGYGEVTYKSNYGNTDISDVLASAEYLVKSQPCVDGARLGIYGHSRGGMMTLLAIERSPGKFKAAVDIAGLTDFLAFMAYKPDFRRMETASEPYFGGKLPAENLAPYLAISPLNYVDEIQTPLFIAATTGDKTVPLNLHTGRLIDALKARNKVFEAKIYDNAPGDHLFLFGDTDERKDLFERSFAFLDKYLKPSAPRSQALP
jgi:dipeptidyl aminopeptidase/acylaminoacyl peptidase